MSAVDVDREPPARARRRASSWRVAGVIAAALVVAVGSLVAGGVALWRSGGWSSLLPALVALLVALVTAGVTWLQSARAARKAAASCPWCSR